MKRASGRPRFFYGWVIVAVLVLFSAIAVGLAGANIAIFITPMSDDLGWSPVTFGWAQIARLAAALIAGPFIGRMLDRRGPRLPVAAAGLVTGGLVVSLAYVRSEWHLVAAFVGMGLLGMGRATELHVGTPVAKWFVRRRGLAMGIGLAGTPIGIVVFYPLTQLLIDLLGWRDAFLVLGIVGMAVVAPAALMFLHRQPEDIGLAPDGDGSVAPAAAHAEAGGETAPRVGEVAWTRADALRSPTLWVMVAGFSVMMYGISTITLFRVPHFVERGLSPTLVVWAIAVDALVAIVVSVYLGRVLDRFPARYVVVLGIAGLGFSALGLVIVDDVLWLFLANIGYGFGFQASAVAQNVMWADYFGRANQGAIRGITIPVTVGLGAVAFPLTGYIRDAAGDYVPAWWMALAALAVAAAILVSVRPPQGHSP